VGKESAESKELQIQACFSLALSNMRVQKGVSRTQRRRLNGIFEDDLVPCFLIGQLARNDQYPEEIGGDEIVAHAMSICKMGHDLVGGRFVRVDCRDIPGLVDFYERNGFRRLQTDDKTGLLQLVRFI
jgi:hypothetical protein